MCACMCLCVSPGVKVVVTDACVGTVAVKKGVRSGAGQRSTKETPPFFCVFSRFQVEKRL